jgi:hypothetical protein
VIQTDDLFLGAYGLLRGGELTGVSVRAPNGRRVAVVAISGPGMDEVLREYHGGRSVVDLRLFKCEMRRLKDAVFEALRRQEEESHAGGGQGVAAGGGSRQPPPRRRR